MIANEAKIRVPTAPNFTVGASGRAASGGRPYCWIIPWTLGAVDRQGLEGDQTENEDGGDEYGRRDRPDDKYPGKIHGRLPFRPSCGLRALFIALFLPCPVLRAFRLFLALAFALALALLLSIGRDLWIRPETEAAKPSDAGEASSPSIRL